MPGDKPQQAKPQQQQAAAAQGPAVKKKVRPYPFEAAIELNGAKKSIDVVFLSPGGFIARLRASTMVFVGEHYKAVFELPVAHSWVNAQIRVIKTYDKSLDLKAKAVERMAEFHFEVLSDEHKKNILSFLSAIGQK